MAAIPTVSAGVVIDPAWGNAVAAALNPSAWTAAALTNSWVNVGGGNAVAAYRKIDDRVEVRGRIRSGTLGTSAFTLPVGFRPPAGLMVPGGGGGASPIAVNLDVFAAGTVTVYASANLDIAINFSFSITA